MTQPEFSPRPTRILLSGASGLLGSALRTALTGRGMELLQLVRRPALNPNELQWNPGDLSPVQETGPLENMDAAIHLSGANVAAHRWTKAYRREMRDSRLVSTAAMARMLAGLQRPPRSLLVASAVGIYGDRGDELLNEDSAPGSGFLAELTREWEASAEPARQAGIRVVHLRFAVVLTPEAGALAKLLPVFRLGLGGRIGTGKQWMSWITLDDTIRAMLFTLDTPRLAGPVNVTSPQPLTNAQFTGALGSALGRPAVLPVPAFALRLALGQMADEALLSSARVVPAKLLEAGFRFGQPDVGNALRSLLRSRDAGETSGSRS